MNNKKGFTLIELLVIGVTGMLASIVLVSLAPVRKKGEISGYYSWIGC